MLNPAFSHAQMRRLYPLVQRISFQIRDILAKEVTATEGARREKVQEVDVAGWFGRTSLELIAQAGFGHTFHALEGDGATYVRALKEIACVIELRHDGLS